MARTELKDILDLNHDGIIENEDVELFEKINQTKNRPRLAWSAMISMIVVTIVMFLPYVTEARITSMKDILEVFYISQASIVGFYMGASTYLDAKLNKN